MNAPAVATALRLLADAIEDGQPTPAEDEAMTMKAAGRVLGVHPSAVGKHLAAGNLKGYGIGKRGKRVYRSSVEDFKRRRALGRERGPEPGA